MLRNTVLGLAALALALSGCGRKADGSGEAAGLATESLVVSVGIAEPKHLLPSSTTEEMGHAVVHALFTGLVEWNEQLEPVEVAAESVTSTDNRVWTIKLKPDWKFHNGEPVTADSYINAWNAGAWGPNAHDGNYFFDKIVGYDEMNPLQEGQKPAATKLGGLVKTDDLTFEVTLKEPYVNFKTMLGYTPFLPLPLAAFSNVANNQIDPAFEGAPIGQGPFRMKGRWLHDQLIEVERNPDYAGEHRPKIAGIAFRVYQAQTTQYQDLLADELDIVPYIPPENLVGARTDLGDRLLESVGSTIQILAFPTFDKRFANPQIRKAISMAIDRQAISTTIYADSQVPLTAFVAPFVPGYRADICGEACTYNPARAKQLFDAAGGASAVGGKLEIAYNVDGGHRPWIEAACNQLRTNLGVDCVGNPEPRFADLLRKAKLKEPIGMFRMGWGADYPAIENFLGPLYATRGSSNYYGYANPEFDRLLAAGDRAATPQAALEFYRQAEDLLVRDLPVAPMRYMKNTYGISRRVANVVMDPYRVVNYLNITAAEH